MRSCARKRSTVRRCSLFSARCQALSRAWPRRLDGHRAACAMRLSPGQGISTALPRRWPGMCPSDADRPCHRRPAPDCRQAPSMAWCSPPRFEAYNLLVLHRGAQPVHHQEMSYRYTRRGSRSVRRKGCEDSVDRFGYRHIRMLQIPSRQRLLGPTVPNGLVRLGVEHVDRERAFPISMYVHAGSPVAIAPPARSVPVPGSSVRSRIRAHVDPLLRANRKIDGKVGLASIGGVGIALFLQPALNRLTRPLDDERVVSAIVLSRQPAEGPITGEVRCMIVIASDTQRLA